MQGPHGRANFFSIVDFNSLDSTATDFSDLMTIIGSYHVSRQLHMILEFTFLFFLSYFHLRLLRLLDFFLGGGGGEGRRGRNIE